MSSTLRTIKDGTNVKREFTVYSYLKGSDNYFFTVEENELYRIENDLSGIDWVVARDMGTQRSINTISAPLIEFWESNDSWESVTVVRPGIARKFQVVSITSGDLTTGTYGNQYAYLSRQDNTPIYNYEYDTASDLLVLGKDASETSVDPLTANLPYGTFWAITDPVVVQYNLAGLPTIYRRAIRNRVDEVTLF